MDWHGLLEVMTDTVRATFGEPVSYERAETGEVFEIEAVFDPDYLLQEAGAKLGVGSRILTLDVVNRDIGGEPEQDDVATIQGRRYRVVDKMPSSSGMTKAILRKAGS